MYCPLSHASANFPFLIHQSALNVFALFTRRRCAVLLLQVIEITCGDSKAVYDEVKSRRGHPVVADVAGADVS
jgi:hypothetical protein